jgi:hypothetical protein
MRLLCLGTVLALSACSAGKDVGAAEGGVARFHAELNSGQFNSIYEQAAPGWKQATNEPDTVKLFSAIHNKLGSFISASQTGWHVNYGTGGTTTLLTFNSKFQKGEAEESFTFLSDGKQVQLMAYNINSRALITG